MSDWQKDDLALCVRTPRGELNGAKNPCKKGRIYVVDRTVLNRAGLLGLGLDGVHFPDCTANAISHYNFVKVTPPADMIEREEVETLEVTA